jgi:aspartyl-tRNA(Asn)/glutamyl-tRNA(Gln) amidotransferase subunit C
MPEFFHAAPLPHLGYPTPMSQPITDSDVRHVAKLARLHLSEAEVAATTAELGSVLGYVGMLAELDVSGVEPLTHALDQINVLRDDAPEPGLPVDEALRNAPDRDGDYFAVPKVIGEGGGA